MLLYMWSCPKLDALFGSISRDKKLVEKALCEACSSFPDIHEIKTFIDKYKFVYADTVDIEKSYRLTRPNLLKKISERLLQRSTTLVRKGQKETTQSRASALALAHRNPSTSQLKENCWVSLKDNPKCLSKGTPCKVKHIFCTYLKEVKHPKALSIPHVAPKRRVIN
ncbi:hypothetical protein Hanom_Chr09g00786641 [Helianthus anomalus]